MNCPLYFNEYQQLKVAPKGFGTEIGWISLMGASGHLRYSIYKLLVLIFVCSYVPLLLEHVFHLNLTPFKICLEQQFIL